MKPCSIIQEIMGLAWISYLPTSEHCSLTSSQQLPMPLFVDDTTWTWVSKKTGVQSHQNETKQAPARVFGRPKFRLPNVPIEPPPMITTSAWEGRFCEPQKPPGGRRFRKGWGEGGSRYIVKMMRIQCDFMMFDMRARKKFEWGNPEEKLFKNDSSLKLLKKKLTEYQGNFWGGLTLHHKSFILADSAPS